MVEASVVVRSQDAQFVLRVFHPTDATDLTNATVSLIRMDVYRTTSACVTAEKYKPFCIC
jgi:hypothetical protein